MNYYLKQLLKIDGIMKKIFIPNLIIRVTILLTIFAKSCKVSLFTIYA